MSDHLGIKLPPVDLQNKTITVRNVGVYDVGAKLQNRLTGFRFPCVDIEFDKFSHEHDANMGADVMHCLLHAVAKSILAGTHGLHDDREAEEMERAHGHTVDHQ
eukprot:gnl/TRDRNA2_/TRDRNA2_175439_c0_seq7.p1 gnl/TRDRNA2_/TRDRNA2_175439_c0~~gnl/TRDRNA2_/TRDRNA2_175439_c0_seq7.p1  ORF type:complete len:119 (-),score=18.04 gnl/TRDRNA2_/TRDRNA2_175439_c0_seq7:28-339(-)